ncbi:RICIN domain-containing protein [Lentzea sp. NPDC060358]|uniref:RICIN domain-containing protein n=1 Tax=Lentzea sp. NPDC060358 TaxID=3347103 RepID=UPI00365DDB42
MTDADQTTNTVSGDVSGTPVQIGDVGRDVNITTYERRPYVLFGVIAAAVVVVSLLVVVADLSDGTKSAEGGSSSPPLASVPLSSAATTSAAVIVAGTTAPPAVLTAKPVQQQPHQPQPQPQPTVPPQPVDRKPVTDGPGYLVPAGNDQRAADFYQNEWNDVVMWERHPPGDATSYQPFWAREFSDANPAVFRLRNQRGNLCMEPVFQDGFGEHVKAGACSWSNDAQLWQAQNTTQFAHVASGRCLGTANDGSYADGTWLIVSLCSGRDDQKWRIAR